MEIEIKSRVRDFALIKRRLSGLGAEYLGEVNQKDIYFNHPSRDFESTDEALRIRYSDERTFMAYKGPKLDKKTKSREEIELEISDGEKAEKILERLGFRKAGTVSKVRERYLLDNTEIAMDDVHGLGLFVELEIIGRYTKENIGKLFDTAQKLGLDEFIQESYLELLSKNEE